MALGPRLDLRQSQSLVMTPQLQQAIKLLALSNLEIETFIGEALEANPLLDIAAPNVLLVSVGCLVYGASNGLITIVRGAVTLQLFGHAGYGATLGRIAAPGLIAGALAPMSYAAAIEHLGHHWALAMLTVISCLGFAGMWRLTWIQNRSARNTPTSDR